MNQIILRNFIDETIFDGVVGPTITGNFEQQKDYLTQWLVMNTDVTESMPLQLQPFKEYVPTKLEELHQITTTVSRITRAVTKVPKPFPMFKYVMDDTSYVLFISTQNVTYTALPITYNTTMEEELPIILNKGDAFLTQYTEEVDSSLSIFSPELRHLCVVYLEPKELWP